MVGTTVRKRFYAETALAAVAAVLGALTLLWRDWIEALTGLDPDAHSGRAEWLVVTGFFLIAAGCAVLARREAVTTRRSRPTS